MISASGLMRHCRHEKVLKARKPKKPEQEAKEQASRDRGHDFHAGVEKWVALRSVPDADDLEIQGWLDLLASLVTPPPGAVCERAWGLDMEGRHVDVTEPEPHKYAAVDGRQLLTAGRCDLDWILDDIVDVFDWKTGLWAVTPVDDNLQLGGAGIAIAQKRGAKGYRPHVYYARDGFLDVGDVVMLGSAAHRVMLAEVRAAALLDDEPHPGAWCSRCWERKGCPQATP